MPRSTLVPVLVAALLLVITAPAQAVSRKQATQGALAALGSSNGTGSVVVFGLPKPLRAGTRVSAAGRLVLRARKRSFFYYEDSGATGRVAFVSARSGQVALSKRFRRAPLVNGKLPAFLTSVARYLSPEYRVFSRSSSTTAVAGSNASVFASGPSLAALLNAHPKADKQDTRVKQNRPKHITLTGSDDDNDFLTYTITQPPDHGTLSGQPPELTYTPDLNYIGKDKFGFKSFDGESQSNTAHVTIDVVPLGSPPVTTTSGGCTAYTERAPAVVVDGLITASDPDDTNLDSARVRISSNFVEGDNLLFTDQNGVSGSYDDRTGILDLNGTASVANYQAALRTVRYRNLAGSSASTTKDVQFTVNDGGSDSAPATKQICITNSAGGTRPIGEPSEGAVQYTENDGQVPLDPGFSAFDPDSANLSGATIRFAATQPGEEDELPPGDPGSPTFNFFPDEDQLFFADQNGITGSYDDVTGVLTLTGTSSVANYEAAIRSITYENSSEDPNEAPRTIRFQLTDSGGATSTPTTRGLLVTAVNDAPVATASAGMTTATGSDPSVVVDSALTVIDVDDQNLEGGQVRIASGFAAGDQLAFEDQNGISGSYDGVTGVLTLTGSAPVADYETALRSVEYRHPDGNPSGTKTVEFVVNDGELDSSATTRDVGVNDAPVLDTTDTALAYTAGDGAVAIDPGITVSDADSTTLASATVHITANGSPEDQIAFTDQLGITGFFDEETGVLTLSGTASVADYETALRSVTYNNTSGDPSTATRTVTFQVNDGETSNNQSEPATRDVEVSPANAAPVVTATDGSTEWNQGGPTYVTIDSGLTVTDADDTNIEGAKVQFSSGFETGDELVFVDTPEISGTYNTGTGVLDLTGTATVGQYEAALQSVQYGHSVGSPAETPKTVEFTANDGDVDSAPASKTIDIGPPIG
jgi:hypothetical protein